MDYKRELIETCVAVLSDRHIDNKAHRDRLKYELKEITTKGEEEYLIKLHHKFKENGLIFPENEYNLLAYYLLDLAEDFDINKDPAYVFVGEMPDIDVDYIPEIRDYLKNDWAPRKYGRAYVANIGSYGTYGMRNSLLDVAKVYGIEREEMLPITKFLPDKDDEGGTITWDKALEIDPNLADFCDKNPEIYEVAKRLSESEFGKRIKNQGKHAAGLIISSKPLTDLVPLILDRSGNITSAFTEGLKTQELGPLGLIKFDLLVIENLMQTARICRLIKDRYGIQAICALPGQKDWSDISYLNDPKAIEMANKADLKCIFQFDSPGIQSLARLGGVTSFDDLAAYTALFRPGPLGGMSDAYIKRKRGDEAYELEPILEPILKDTYGVMVYQEQVQKMLKELGSVPDSDTEKVRKAISKKKIDIFGKYKEQFLTSGAQKLKRDCDVEIPKDAKEVLGKIKPLTEEKVADYAFFKKLNDPYPKALGYLAAFSKKGKDYLHTKVAEANARFIWDQIEAFSDYGFNKAHAYEYTYISARLLWLKAHYPLEFYAGILSCETDEKKIQEYKTEATIHGVPLYRVSINKSQEMCAIYQENEEPSPFDKIYFGLANIKGIGKVAKKIVENAPYDSFEDFLTRFGTDANVIKPLLTLGVFGDDNLVKLYKYYEDFKSAKKSRNDRVKRFDNKQKKYNEELKELLTGHEKLATWDEDNIIKWEQFDNDEVVEEVCRKPGPDFGKVVQKKFNLYKKLKSLWNRRFKGIERHIEKEKECDESPFTLGRYDVELSEVYVPKEMLDYFENRESAEEKFLGFRWDHPLLKSPNFTNKTFAAIRQEMEEVDVISTPIEILVVDWNLREWKNKKGHNYMVFVEDANGEKQKITVWPDDWERFKNEFKQGALLRMKVNPPTKFGYTLSSVPKYKRHLLPPKDKDFRVVRLEYGE
jgi:DNA polymerase III alpha subunit